MVIIFYKSSLKSIILTLSPFCLLDHNSWYWWLESNALLAQERNQVSRLRSWGSWAYYSSCRQNGFIFPSNSLFPLHPQRWIKLRNKSSKSGSTRIEFKVTMGLTSRWWLRQILQQLCLLSSSHQSLFCCLLSGLLSFVKYWFCSVPFAFGLGEQVEICVGNFPFRRQAHGGWWPYRCGLAIDSTSTTQLGVMVKTEEEVQALLKAQLLLWKATPLIIQTQWKMGLSPQWPLLRLGSLKKPKWLLLQTRTLMLMAPYQVIWPFVTQFASLEKQHIFSYYQGYFLCRLWLDYFVHWEWFSSLAINSSASKVGFIWDKVRLPFPAVISIWFLWLGSRGFLTLSFLHSVIY